MVRDTHTYARLTEAETAELRHSLDDALIILRAVDDGTVDAGEDDSEAINTFNEILYAVSESTIETPEQLDLLFDLIDYLGGDNVHPFDLEMDELCPHYRALAALGRHVMAQRRLAKADHAELKARLDS